MIMYFICALDCYITSQFRSSKSRYFRAAWPPLYGLCIKIPRLCYYAYTPCTLSPFIGKYGYLGFQAFWLVLLLTNMFNTHGIL